MTCEVRMCVVVYIVTGLSCTIFSGTGDKMAQKMSSYVQSYEYVEFFDGL